jgi:hypothetical protein
MTRHVQDSSEEEDNQYEIPEENHDDDEIDLEDDVEEDLSDSQLRLRKKARLNDDSDDDEEDGLLPALDLRRLRKEADHRHAVAQTPSQSTRQPNKQQKSGTGQLNTSPYASSALCSRFKFSFEDFTFRFKKTAETGASGMSS